LPLHRRIPKRGFTNRFRKLYATINLKDLERFESGTKITPDLLQERGFVKDLKAGLKILAEGVLSKPLSVAAHRFSKQAVEKILASGGKIEVIGS
jgi:large subunit ribosomal protein L15